MTLALTSHAKKTEVCVCACVTGFSVGSIYDPPLLLCVCWDTYVRFGVLENDERQGEVLLRQADQILCEQRFSSILSLSLTAVQEWHHPLEGIFHVALCAGLETERDG